MQFFLEPPVVFFTITSFLSRLGKTRQSLFDNQSGDRAGSVSTNRKHDNQLVSHQLKGRSNELIQLSVSSYIQMNDIGHYARVEWIEPDDSQPVWEDEQENIERSEGSESLSGWLWGQNWGAGQASLTILVFSLQPSGDSGVTVSSWPWLVWLLTSLSCIWSALSWLFNIQFPAGAGEIVQSVSVLLFPRLSGKWDRLCFCVVVLYWLGVRELCVLTLTILVTRVTP